MADANRHIRLLHGERDATFHRLNDAPPETTPHLIGKVFDGGALSTEPDRWCLVHPMGADGSEVEGSTADLIVDTDVVVPVLVLNDAPQVDDVLQAFGVSGFWIAEKGGVPAPTCEAMIQVSQCGDYDFYTGRLRVTQGGFSQTVSPTGFPSVWRAAIPGSGLYHIESIDPQPTRHEPIDVDKTLTCSGTAFITFPVSEGYRCPTCAPLDKLADPPSQFGPIPLTLTGTNSRFGSCVMTYDAVNLWYRGSKPVTFPASTFGGSGAVCPESAGTLIYTWYQRGGVFSNCTFGVTAVRDVIPITCGGESSHGVNPNAITIDGVRSDVPLYFEITVDTGVKALLYGDYFGPVTFTVSE